MHNLPHKGLLHNLRVLLLSKSIRTVAQFVDIVLDLVEVAEGQDDEMAPLRVGAADAEQLSVVVVVDL